jgi:predicted Rossmann fold flavoprotein
MSEPVYDVAVIGAGAAGLMASIRAAELGRRVILLEKNRKPGVKILMSGGTRCNITHNTTNRGIVAAYGPQGKFLHSPLAAFSVQNAIDFFNGEGVETKVEDTGKIFPVSNKALDVLEALTRRVQRSGAFLALEEPVTALGPHETGFALTTPKRNLNVPKLIVTCGGLSYPGCGTRGDGYGFARMFGHTIVDTKPSLVPITTNVPWVADLKGVTLADVGLKVLDGETVLITKRNGFLFAHFGLTGPAPLDASKAISKHPKPQSLQLELDFLPAVPEAEFDAFLQRESLASGKKQLAVVMSEHLPRRLCDVVLTICNQPPDRKATGLGKADRLAIVKAVKRNRIPVTGTLGFEKAEVTTGGVSLDEVDSRTMQSKLHANLFFAGEVLDLDGPIGGYNFQAAWSTGWLAGQSV